MARVLRLGWAAALALAWPHPARAQRALELGAEVSSLIKDFRSQPSSPLSGLTASPVYRVSLQDGSSEKIKEGFLRGGFVYTDAAGGVLAKAASGGRAIEVKDSAGAALGLIKREDGGGLVLLDREGRTIARFDGRETLRNPGGAPVAKLRRKGDGWQLEIAKKGSVDARVAVMLALAEESAPGSGREEKKTLGRPKLRAETLAEAQVEENMEPGEAGPSLRPEAAGPAMGAYSAVPSPSPRPVEPSRPSLFGFLRNFAEWVGHFLQKFFGRILGLPGSAPERPSRGAERPNGDRELPGLPVARPVDHAPQTPSLRLFANPLSRPFIQNGVMRDASGRQLLLRGVNLSERSKRPPFAGWLRPEHADAVVRMGFDHVRFLLTWEAVEPKDGVFDEEYLALVREEISWFASRGVYVVVDMHQDQFSRRFGGDGMPDWVLLKDTFGWFPDVIAPFPINYINPKVVANFMSFWGNKTKRARLAKAWAHVVSELKGCPAILGYDLLNEPFPGFRFPWDFDAKELSTLQAEIAAAIRAEDSQRILFLEPEALAAAFPFTGLKLADPNSVYAPHWYDPIVDLRAILGIRPAYDGDWRRTDQALKNLQAHARRMGIPMWLGEYGIERDRLGSAQYVRDHNRLLDERLISASYWELNPVEKDGFTFIGPDGKDYPLADELARPHPRAVAGRLTRVSYDQGAKRLEVSWSEGRLGPTAPTLIELPAKVYGLGAPLDISLSDPDGTWRAERDPVSGRLAVWADPGSREHTLVIRPKVTESEPTAAAPSPTAQAAGGDGR